MACRCKKHIEFVCLTCGGRFERCKYQQKRANFCSRYCVAKYYAQRYREAYIKKKIEMVCGWCGKSFLVKQYRKNTAKYCSDNCRIKSVKKILSNRKNLFTGKYKKCVSCNKTFYVPPSHDAILCCSRSCAQKIKWQDKKYREKIIKAQLKGSLKRPTLLEKQMISIIERNHLPYRYTGDGSFLIGWKNPDFVNINGEKKLIEVGSEYHKKYSYGSVENYIRQRSEHFAKYGWESYIFIDEKLNEDQILKTLKGE